MDLEDIYFLYPNFFFLMSQALFSKALYIS